MICCYCHRTKEKIVGSIENKQKVTHATVIEVLYKDSQKRLACPRCVASLDLVLVSDGHPAVTYKPKAKKYQQNVKSVKDAISEPLLEEEPRFLMK